MLALCQRLPSRKLARPWPRSWPRPCAPPWLHRQGRPSACRCCHDSLVLSRVPFCSPVPPFPFLKPVRRRCTPQATRAPRWKSSLCPGLLRTTCVDGLLCMKRWVEAGIGHRKGPHCGAGNSVTALLLSEIGDFLRLFLRLPEAEHRPYTRPFYIGKALRKPSFRTLRFAQALDILAQEQQRAMCKKEAGRHVGDVLRTLAKLLRMFVAGSECGGEAEGRRPEQLLAACLVWGAAEIDKGYVWSHLKGSRNSQALPTRFQTHFGA